MKMLNSFLTICTCIFISSVFSLDQERKVYIVYMGSLPEGEYLPSLHHSQIIEKVVHPSFASQSLIRSYKRSFNGFAAYLSEEEKQKLTKIFGVVSIFPCRKSQLQTTRSWDFMGLSTTTKRHAAIESDIIIGVIDSGIWPELESFNDEGFGPIPTKWKGVCDGGKDFICNRKIIGARTYSVESRELSAWDKDGHGTHVASILAGNQVRHANYYGLAHGIARGGVPSARLAIYKVCDPKCHDTDILSAFDHAIADGVDIISISINHDVPIELTYDPIAIGSFHAIEKGILTVNAAGNRGPFLSSTDSYAPWILTVAASDTDRRIINKLLLENNEIIVGNAINAFPSGNEASPLVYGKEVTSSCSETDARKCLAQCLESSLVEHKILLCDSNPDFTLEAVKTVGALGCIYSDSINVSMIMPFPALALSRNDFNLVKSYKQSTMELDIQILKSEAVENRGAPFVALFSARGPSKFIPDIIKPDVTAPGVEILAAFSPVGSPSGNAWDANSVKFNILSGTSMACPHVAAAAAFVKSFHPEWSPSAIKSALMTTAWEFDASLYAEAEFAYGSGHIDPVKATKPGLVYETYVEEYHKIWCNISQTLGSVIPTNASCPMKLTPKDINYPSMAVEIEGRNAYTVSFSRTVTNVGKGRSTYIAYIDGDHSNLDINVEPSILQFKELNQKVDFVVTVRGKEMKHQTIKCMSLVWSDGVHRVRSPIVIHTLGTTSNGEKNPPTHVIFVTFMMIIIMLVF